MLDLSSAALVRHQSMLSHSSLFLNVSSTPEIYPLSLHDALPISRATPAGAGQARRPAGGARRPGGPGPPGDRKSTRLNSSHLGISYAVFCLKKKNIKNNNRNDTDHTQDDAEQQHGRHTTE